jgi:hypothetical protein
MFNTRLAFTEPKIRGLVAFCAQNSCRAVMKNDAVEPLPVSWHMVVHHLRRCISLWDLCEADGVVQAGAVPSVCACTYPSRGLA